MKGRFLKNYFKRAIASSFMAILLIMGLFATASFAASPAPTYTEDDFKLIYETEKVTLSNMPVVDNQNRPITKPVKLQFWNGTLQRYEEVVTSENGVLPDVELIKGHHYIVYSLDEEYNFVNNAYLVLNESGALPLDDRAKISGTNMSKLVLNQRKSISENPIEESRVEVNLFIFGWDVDYEDLYDDFDLQDMISEDGTKLVLKSPNDTVVAPIEDGSATVRLLEDQVYTVSLQSEKFDTFAYPLTVKDHSEENRGKKPYNHLSCVNKGEIIIFEKGKIDKSQYNTILKSPSKKTEVTGENFDHRIMPWPMEMRDTPRYALNEKEIDVDLDNTLRGDYSVLDLHFINMARIERSAWTSGNFDIKTEINEGKIVKKLYYMNSENRLTEIPFEQEGNKISFHMDSFSIYPIVVQYETENPNNNYIQKDAGNKKWTPNDTEGISLRFGVDGIEDDRSFAYFDGIVKVDDVVVDNKYYTATKGSVIINFKPEYLSTLAEGVHRVSLSFEDGNRWAIGEFEIGRAETEETIPEDKAEVDGTPIGETDSKLSATTDMENTSINNEKAKNAVNTSGDLEFTMIWIFMAIVSTWELTKLKKRCKK